MSPTTTRRAAAVLKPAALTIALHVLAYNLKRVMSILGPGPLIAAIREQAMTA